MKARDPAGKTIKNRSTYFFFFSSLWSAGEGCRLRSRSTKHPKSKEGGGESGESPRACISVFTLLEASRARDKDACNPPSTRRLRQLPARKIVYVRRWREFSSHAAGRAWICPFSNMLTRLRTALSVKPEGAPLRRVGSAGSMESVICPYRARKWLSERQPVCVVRCSDPDGASATIGERDLLEV
ncbi:hypothetical protein VTG60DRAFT_54 [Thermothelomyces hinnuleus]